GGVPESAPRVDSAALQAGAEVRAQFLAADDRRSAADDCALPRRLGRYASRRVAAHVRRRRNQRRSILGEDRPHHGPLLHAVWGLRAVLARRMGEYLHGRGLRRSARSVRSDYREEARWLDLTFSPRKGPRARTVSAVGKPAPPIWTA